MLIQTATLTQHNWTCAINYRRTLVGQLANQSAGLGRNHLSSGCFWFCARVSPSLSYNSWLMVAEGHDHRGTEQHTLLRRSIISFPREGRLDNPRRSDEPNSSREDLQRTNERTNERTDERWCSRWEVQKRTEAREGSNRKPHRSFGWIVCCWWRWWAACTRRRYEAFGYPLYES